MPVELQKLKGMPKGWFFEPSLEEAKAISEQFKTKTMQELGVPQITEKLPEPLPIKQLEGMPEGWQIEVPTAGIVPPEVAGFPEFAPITDILGRLPIGKEKPLQPARPAEIRPALPAPKEKMREMLLRPFIRKPEEELKRAGTILNISESTGLPKYFVDKNFKELTKAYGAQYHPGISEQLMMGIGIYITPSLITAPVTTALGVGGFAAVNELVNGAVSLIKSEPYKFMADKGFSDLAPDEANEFTKDTLDILEFIIEGMVAAGIYKKAPQVAEKLTKEIVTRTLPVDKVRLSPEKIRAIFIGKKGIVSPEEAELWKSLGLSKAEIKSAVDKGIEVEIQPEKIINLVDKPYWAKIKRFFGIKPSIEEIGRIPVEKVYKELPKGLLPETRPPITAEVPTGKPPSPPLVVQPEISPPTAEVTKTIKIKGYFTKLGDRYIPQRSAGTYIALDEPFQPEKGELYDAEVKNINPLKIFDPNGLIEGTDVEKSKVDFELMIDEFNEMGKRGEIKGIRGRSKAMTKILKKMGYEAEAGWIDGEEEKTRELVIFDKNKVSLTPVVKTAPGEKPTIDTIATKYNISPPEKEFIVNKVKSLLTVEAVNNQYNRDDVISKFAREIAPIVLAEKPSIELSLVEQEIIDRGHKINPDGTITLYHGTTKEKAKQILDSGVLKKPEDAPDSYGVYLSTSPDISEDYGDGTVIKVNIPVKDLNPDDVFPSTGRMDFRVETKKGIYKPIKIESEKIAPVPEVPVPTKKPVKEKKPADKIAITETPTETIVKPALTAIEQRKMPAKEQKAFLINEIDKAIEISTEEGKVTIVVPDNGEFTIYNTKEALGKFKDIIKKDFPSTDWKLWEMPELAKKPVTKQTGKRIKGEDIEYYNEFQPRKQPIITDDIRNGKNFYYKNFYTDGYYFIKTDTKPVLKKVEYIEKKDWEAFDDLLKDVKDAIPAKIIAEFQPLGRSEKEPSCAHIETEEGEHFLQNAHQIDVILTQYPEAKAFVVPTSIPENKGMLYFIHNNEVVGGIMPIKVSDKPLTGKIEDIVNRNQKKWFKEKYAELKEKPVEVKRPVRAVPEKIKHEPSVEEPVLPKTMVLKTQTWVKEKVKKLGSIEEVNKFFYADNVRDTYGREYAKYLFGGEKPVKKPKRKEPEGIALAEKKWEINLEKEPVIEKIINKTEMFRNLEKTFGVPIKTKATHRWKNAGMYYPKKWIVRLRKWGDIAPATHEIAHHLDHQVFAKKYGDDWKTSEGNVKTINRELADLDYNEKRRSTKEGFAEFMRYYLTTDLAKSKAPTFYKTFTETILANNPDIAKKLTDTKEMIDIWQGQGAENRIIAQIDFKEEHIRVPGIKSKIRKSYEFLLRHFNDEFYYAQKVVKEIEEITGKKLKPSENPATLMEYGKSKAGFISRTFILDKAVDETGNIVGKGLVEILKPIQKNEIKKFIAYAVSKRAINIENRGKESGFDIDDAKYIVELYKDDKWDKVIDEITEWSNHLLNWVVRAGGLGENEAQIIREMNPIYLPFKRAFVDELYVIKGTGGKFVNRGQAIKRLKGSGRPIVNPLESLIVQATEMISKAQKIRIASVLADIAEREGIGGFITKVPAPIQVRDIAISNIKDFKSILADMGIEEEEIKELDMDQLTTVFFQGWQYMGKDNIVSIWKNGKRSFYEIHPDLYKTLTGMDSNTSRNTFFILASKFSRMLRLGATSLKLSFNILNPFRDAFTYAVFSKNNNATIFDSALGMYKESRSVPGDLIWRFKHVGGSLSGFIGFDRAATMNTYDDMMLDKLGKKGKVLKVVKHPINTFRELVNFGELAPRSIEMEQSYKRLKKENPEWTEEDLFIESFNDAQDVTINFTKSGITGKWLNEIAAFFNVAIRGPEKAYRSFKFNPIRTLAKGVGWITAFALLNWYRNKDKDWYKNLPPSYKYSNFWFELGEKTIVRLPIPFDLGILFASLPVATIETLYYKDRKYVNELMKLVKRQIPDPTPSMFEPLIDVAQNKNYLGTPIESEGMKFMPVTERTRYYTTKLATTLSKGFDTIGVELSPVQIDYMLNSYTGGFFRQVPINPIFEPADIPVLGDLLLRTPDNPRRQLNNFFSDWEVLTQKHAANTLSYEENIKYNKLKQLYSRISFELRNIKTLINKKPRDMDKTRERYKNIGEILDKYGYK